MVGVGLASGNPGARTGVQDEFDAIIALVVDGLVVAVEDEALVDVALDVRAIGHAVDDDMLYVLITLEAAVVETVPVEVTATTSALFLRMNSW